jgi:hypothetical protein
MKDLVASHYDPNKGIVQRQECAISVKSVQTQRAMVREASSQAAVENPRMGGLLARKKSKLGSLLLVVQTNCSASELDTL